MFLKGDGGVAILSTRGGIVRARTTGALVAEPNGLIGLSCTSGRLCVAGDESGNILSSTDLAESAQSWTTLTWRSRSISAGSAIGSVLATVCPSTSLCFALGYEVEASTHPASGGWTHRAVSGEVPHEQSSALDAISCASTSLCVVATADGDVVPSTDPTGPSSAWNRLPVNGGEMTAISCVSAPLCVAVNTTGDVVTSRNPTLGSSWSITDVEPSSAPPGQAGFTSVSCPSASLCVAVDSDGNAIVSRDPTGAAGAAGAWRRTQIDAHQPLTGVSCGSTRLCIAVDSTGNEISLSNPATSNQSATRSRIDSSQLTSVSNWAGVAITARTQGTLTATSRLTDAPTAIGER